MLVQAGASEQGLEIAAASADVVYSAPHDIDTAKAYYANLKGRLARYGRAPGDLLVMPGFTPSWAARSRKRATNTTSSMRWSIRCSASPTSMARWVTCPAIRWMGRCRNPWMPR
ncbi:LLM class flavin-dependent oxidoreductase [Pseudoroseomonas wenyumeiae]